MREQVFTLDLSEAAVLESILKFKKILGHEGDSYSFLQAIAIGLVRVFESRTDNSDNVSYLAASKLSSIVGCGIAAQQDVASIGDEEIILAKAFVPAHPL